MITVDPGDRPDGNPVQGRMRTWRMLYLDPDLVSRSLTEEVPDVLASGEDVLRTVWWSWR